MATSYPKKRKIPCKRITSAEPLTSTDTPDGPDDLEASCLKHILESKSKKVKVRYSTVLCTGQPKVGKTKFCHSLMNQDTPPPGKGDFYKVFIKAKTESTWTEIDIKQLSILIDQANKLNESEHQGPMNPSTDESKCATKSGTMSPDEILDILILVDINVPTPTVSLLQPALVTFVTYKLFGKEDHVCAKTCAFIKELMSSYCFTDVPRFNELEIANDFEREFYTAFIGTFFDDDNSSEALYKKEVDLVCERLQNLESCVNCSMQGMPLSFWYLENNNYLQTINLISTQDEAFKNLRDKLKKTVEQNPAFQIPITWLLLSLKIQKLYFEEIAQGAAPDKVQYLQYNVVKKIWNSECKMRSDESELKLALRFFHHNGVLFHFDAIEGARDYVFVNCRWMFGLLKDLLTGFKDEGRNLSAKELLMKEGILKSKMIREINFEGPGEMTLSTFLKLLIHLKFIAEVKMNNERLFFMPCILESYESGEKCFDKYGNKCHDALLITFSTGSMHRSVFCFLSAYILNNMPMGWSKLCYDKRTKQQHTFKDLITFSIIDGYYVCIIDRVFSLEVCMYSKSQQCNPELHIKVYGIVEEALKDVCRSVEIPYEECRYGFLCSKCETDDHMMILMDHTDHSARCSKDEDPQPLSPSQSVWLKQKSVTESKPQQDSDVHTEEVTFENFVPAQPATREELPFNAVYNGTSVERRCDVTSVDNLQSNYNNDELAMPKSTAVQYPKKDGTTWMNKAKCHPVSRLITGSHNKTGELNPNEKPTLKKLQNLKVILGVGIQWYKLGIELLEEGNQQAKLKTIEKDYADNERRCMEMFDFWLKTHVTVTWYDIVNSLREVQIYSIAQELEDKFNDSQLLPQSAPVDPCHQYSQHDICGHYHTLPVVGHTGVLELATEEEKI